MPLAINELDSIFTNMSSTDQVNRLRGIRNAMAVAGVEGGMFDSSEIAQLITRGFDVDGYNLLLKYVKGISGSYISNWFDPKFSPATDSDVSIDTVNKLEDIYISDKGRNGYKISAMKTVWDGLIYRGVEEITINRPLLSDPRTWTIGFRNVRADSIIFDQGNTDDRLSRNSKSCIRFGYYTAQQIESQYPDKAEAIRFAKAWQKGNIQASNDHNAGLRDAPFDYNEETRNNRLQIVEYYHIENTRVKHDVYIKTGEKIPESEFKYGSDEDMAFKRAWAYDRNIVLTEKDIFPVEEIKPILMVDVWCPELHMILDQGKDERQLDGRLPFFAWSYIEMIGVSIGLVDTLWSSQHDINKREKAKTKWIEKTPVQKLVVHPDIVGGDATKIKKLAADSSDPSIPVIADESVDAAMMKSMITLTPAAQVPNQVLNDETSKMNLMDQISGLTPPMQGMTGNSAESAQAYTSKVIEGSVGQKYPQEYLIEHERDKVESWLMLVPVVYGGPANYNRKFKKGTGKETIQMNTFIGRNEDGSPVVADDLSDLERVDVTIGKATESDFAKQQRMSMDIDFLSRFTPTPYNTELIASVQCNIALNREFSSDDQKKQTEEICDRTLRMAQLSSEAQIAIQESQRTQADAASVAAVSQNAMTETNVAVQQSQAELAIVSAEAQKQQIVGGLMGQQQQQPQNVPMAQQ